MEIGDNIANLISKWLMADLFHPVKGLIMEPRKYEVLAMYIRSLVLLVGSFSLQFLYPLYHG